MAVTRRRPMNRRPAAGGRRGGKGRLLAGLVMAAIALISFFASRTYNPVTGENQHISLTPKQEIALGLQAEPQMIEQYGGLYPEQQFQDFVDQVGAKLVTEKRIRTHLLLDRLSNK